MRYFVRLIGTTGTVLVSLLMIIASASSAEIVSTFDTDRDGWLSVTLPFPTPGYPPSVLGTFTPDYNSTGGNPGGYISIIDPDGGLPVGNTQFWSAPSKFLGNQGTSYGGSLSFDLSNTPSNNQFNEEDLVLVGGGLTLVFDTLGNLTASWTHYSVGLLETGWKVDSLTGLAATQAQMQSALSSLSALYIRGEFQLGADTEGLDNVRLAASAIPEPSAQTLLGSGGLVLAGYLWRRGRARTRAVGA
jgi:Laminin B (Domain IV)